MAWLPQQHGRVVGSHERGTHDQESHPRGAVRARLLRKPGRRKSMGRGYPWRPAVDSSGTRSSRIVRERRCRQWSVTGILRGPLAGWCSSSGRVRSLNSTLPLARRPDGYEEEEKKEKEVSSRCGRRPGLGSTGRFVVML